MARGGKGQHPAELRQASSPTCHLSAMQRPRNKDEFCPEIHIPIKLPDALTNICPTTVPAYCPGTLR